MNTDYTPATIRFVLNGGNTDYWFGAERPSSEKTFLQGLNDYGALLAQRIEAKFPGTEVDFDVTTNNFSGSVRFDVLGNDEWENERVKELLHEMSESLFADGGFTVRESEDVYANHGYCVADEQAVWGYGNTVELAIIDAAQWYNVSVDAVRELIEKGESWISKASRAAIIESDGQKAERWNYQGRNSNDIYVTLSQYEELQK